MSKKILLIEDDDIIISGLRYVLEAENFAVQSSKSAQTVKKDIAEQVFDLVLLDVTLPDSNGFDAFKIIKNKQPTVPIIFLTAIDDEGNVVKGLEMGADDYVTKPFRVRELMARIKAVLRRGETGETCKILTISDIKIYVETGRVEKANQEVELTAQEYKLLLMLARHQGKILSRQQLLENLWDDEGEFVNDNTLSVVIKRLREKLGDEEGKIIIAIRGLGYRAER